MSRYPMNVNLGDLFKATSKDEGLAALADIAKSMLPAGPVRGAWFKNQAVSIDGYTFEDCRFDSCQLVTESATFSFRRCFISSDCRLFFRGPALKTVRFLMHALQLQKRVEVRVDELGVYATINSDGTFTLE